jgi:hypothetical protein
VGNATPFNDQQTLGAGGFEAVLRKRYLQPIDMIEAAETGLAIFI